MQSVSLYEINGEEGIRVSSQIIDDHVNSPANAMINCCQLSQQNVFGVGDQT